MKKLRMARPQSRALNVFEMASDYWSKSEEEVSTVGERWRGQLMSCSQPQYGNSDQIHSKMENVQSLKEKNRKHCQLRNQSMDPRFEWFSTIKANMTPTHGVTIKLAIRFQFMQIHSDMRKNIWKKAIKDRFFYFKNIS